jgi:hypothetical protein
MVIGIFLSTYYAGTYVIDSDMIRLDLSTLYTLYFIPIYSLIYGSLSYVKIKKVWAPQLILYFITAISYLLINLIIDKELDAWKNILVFSVYPVIFSLMGTGITALIYKIIKSIKESKNQKP